MSDAITLDEAIAAVEREARTATEREQALYLFAAVTFLRRHSAVIMPATEALDRRAADEARIAAARVGAALDRARTP